MKRLLTILASLGTTFTMLLAPASAFAATYWQVDISTPATQNSRTFAVEYTVLSTDSDNFTVDLMQDGVGVAAPEQHTNSDPNAINGNSGSFTVTVPADGDYTYHVEASRDGSADPTKSTASRTVHVDSTAPDAPIYNGKTQSGNTYTVNFTAPSTADVTNVKVFASTSKTYTADSAHQVGNVTVTPNQPKSFNYTAPDGTTRYFSVQAFDAAGNGSAIVGDPGTVVNPVVFVNNGNTATTTAATTTGTAAATGTVLSATTGTTTTPTTGQVNASGTSKTSASKPKGTVLGTETTKKASHNAAWWTGGVLLLALTGIGYYVFSRRRARVN